MQRADLEAISEAAGVPATTTPIEFTGPDDPTYPSPLRLGEGTAALLANVAGAVSDITAATSGTPQSARIDVGHALVSISSMWVLRVNGVLAGEALADEMAPGQGIFTTRDGRHLYLLSGFAHIVERTLEAIGCHDVTRLAEHVAERDSAELEAALVEAQLTGVVLRDAEQWAAHPQGRLLAESPTVRIERIGDAPPTPLPEGAQPLSGLRVLDSTRVLAGPTISRTLAGLGADVLHVGSPNVPDLQSAQADTGHGKRRAFVDLETPEGVDAMWHLIEGADVFSQSYRAESLARRGLGLDAVAARRPGIIYVSENAYGQSGPWREKRGFDGNVQAASGIASLHQRPDQFAPDGSGDGDERLLHGLLGRLRRAGGAQAPRDRGRLVARDGLARPDGSLVPAHGHAARNRRGSSRARPGDRLSAGGAVLGGCRVGLRDADASEVPDQLFRHRAGLVAHRQARHARPGVATALTRARRSVWCDLLDRAARRRGSESALCNARACARCPVRPRDARIRDRMALRNDARRQHVGTKGIDSGRLICGCAPRWRSSLIRANLSLTGETKEFALAA